MGLRPNGTDAVYGDVGRQQAVQFVGQQHGVHGSIGIEMRHHQRGMHPGIGTPRPHHVHLATQQGGEGAHQALLHTQTVGLYLPAVIGCAVVGKVDEISLHVSV